MSAGGWVSLILVALVVWFAIALVVGLLLGPVLRRSRERLGGDDD